MIESLRITDFTEINYSSRIKKDSFVFMCERIINFYMHFMSVSNNNNKLAS